MDGAGKVIHQERPGKRLLPLVPAGGLDLFRIRLIAGPVLTGMRLTEEDVDELHLVTETGVELLERRNCAEGDGSGLAAEVEQHRSASSVGQPETVAFGGLEIEVGSLRSRAQARTLRRS